MKTKEANPVVNPLIRRRNRREIVVDWPEPPIEFPNTQGQWDPAFPVLMFPWGGGQPLIYSVEDQYTYFKKVPPKWWANPNVDTHAIGEEYRLGMGALRFSLAYLYNLSGGGPSGEGIQIDAATWLINDLYEPDLDANQRAFKMVNLPVQPEGVSFVRPVQVSDEENFNRYLANFQESGFIGALLRPLSHRYGEPQHSVIHPL